VRSLETLGPDGQGSLRDRSDASVPHFKDARAGRMILPRSCIHLAPRPLERRHADSWKSRLERGGACHALALLAGRRAAARASHLSHAWLFVAVNTLLLSGGKILFLPKFDSTQCLALMPQATTMMGVPTFYTRLLRHENLSRERTAHMRLFISAPRHFSKRPTALGSSRPDMSFSNATE